MPTLKAPFMWHAVYMHKPVVLAQPITPMSRCCNSLRYAEAPTVCRTPNGPDVGIRVAEKLMFKDFCFLRRAAGCRDRPSHRRWGSGKSPSSGGDWSLSLGLGGNSWCKVFGAGTMNCLEFCQRSHPKMVGESWIDRELSQNFH